MTTSDNEYPNTVDPVKILPCPHCGGQARVRYQFKMDKRPDSDGIATFWVVCDTCGAASETIQDAIAKWNLRNQEPTP